MWDLTCDDVDIKGGMASVPHGTLELIWNFQGDEDEGAILKRELVNLWRRIMLMQGQISKG